MINLLSNAVKFTQAGLIKLKIEVLKEENQLSNEMESIVLKSQNSLSNYLDSERALKKIDVNTERSNNKDLIEILRSKKEFIRFSVIDTGCGIPPDIIDSINSMDYDEKKNNIFAKL